MVEDTNSRSDQEALQNIMGLGKFSVRKSYYPELQKKIEELRQNEENLRITLQSIGDAVIATDTIGVIERMNPMAEKLTGWSFDDAKGKMLGEVFCLIHADTRQKVENSVDLVLTTGKLIELGYDLLLISRDGREYRIADSVAPIRDADSVLKGVVLVFRDVTEDFFLQEQLRQSQKMEAIGQLAGGIAHDFNNMLSGIISAAQLLKSPKRNLDERGKTYADIILKAASRAADLTDKLLAFGRKGKIASTAVDVHQIIDDTIAILQSTIDKRIILKVVKNAENSMVVGDNAGLQSAFLNIAINASHAMPDGGEIRIQTRNIHLGREDCETKPFDIEPGEFIEFSFSDTGCGIAKDDVTRIFEPFYTTKEQGKGTGLGLAAVYGMVQDHHGMIHVESELGKGTTFYLFLPCSESTHRKVFVERTDFKGSGTIMLVDDEEVIRVTGKGLFEEMGYGVIVAADGYEAVKIYEAEKDKIDLVILDMIMPGMNGHEVYSKLKEIDGDCKIIIASGFTKTANFEELKKLGVTRFIRKPFRNSEVCKVLSELLPTFVDGASN